MPCTIAAPSSPRAARMWGHSSRCFAFGGVSPLLSSGSTVQIASTPHDPSMRLSTRRRAYQPTDPAMKKQRLKDAEGAINMWRQPLTEDNSFSSFSTSFLTFRSSFIRAASLLTIFVTAEKVTFPK